MPLALLVFSFTITCGYSITNLLSDIYVDDVGGAMKALADICNGPHVDFYISDGRRNVTPDDYDTFDDMVDDVGVILTVGDVSCEIIFKTLCTG